MTRHSLIAAGLAVALAALVPSPARVQSGDFAAAEERFEGTWQLAVSPDRAQQTIDTAVERAVNAMPFLFRGVARGRLRDQTPAVRRIVLDFDDGAVAVSYDGRDYRSPLGETRRVTRSSDGARLRLTQRLQSGGQLEQVFEGDSGTRWYVYEATGPDTIRLTSTTDSDRMPEAMRFSLTYRRQ